MASKDLPARAKKIKLLVLDCDGVLTDEKVYFFDNGAIGKAFNIKDGFAITLLNRAGIPSAIVTAQKSTLVTLRARQLRIEAVYEAKADKLKAYDAIKKRFKVRDQEICFMGDDLIDLPLLTRVGFAVAVKNAARELKAKAHYVTRARGGEGAVREVAEIIMKARGLWSAQVRHYSR